MIFTLITQCTLNEHLLSAPLRSSQPTCRNRVKAQKKKNLKINSRVQWQLKTFPHGGSAKCLPNEGSWWALCSRRDPGGAGWWQKTPWTKRREMESGPQGILRRGVGKRKLSSGGLSRPDWVERMAHAIGEKPVWVALNVELESLEYIQNHGWLWHFQKFHLRLSWVFTPSLWIWHLHLEETEHPYLGGFSCTPKTTRSWLLLTQPEVLFSQELFSEIFLAKK